MFCLALPSAFCLALPNVRFIRRDAPFCPLLDKSGQRSTLAAVVCPLMTQSGQSDSTTAREGNSRLWYAGKRDWNFYASRI